MKLTVIFIAALICLGSTVAIAGNYEILYETRNGNSWFGGDDRAAASPRNFGGGQSVLIDADILLESFSFYYVTRFDYFENPDGVGHNVTLTLHIRDAAGAVLQTVLLDVPDTYAGGWVTWTGIDRDVVAGTTLIFTAFLNGAFDTSQYTNPQGADTGGGYAGGSRYAKSGTGDATMAPWSGWGSSPWDFMFWLQGSTPVPVETTSWGAVKALYASQQ